MQEVSSAMICSLSISSIRESSIASTCCIPAELLSNVIIVSIRQRHCSCIVNLLLILCLLLLVNLYLRRCQGHLLNKMQIGVTASNKTLSIPVILCTFSSTAVFNRKGCGQLTLQAYAPSTRMASRSCSYSWLKSHGTAGSSFGEM